MNIGDIVVLSFKKNPIIAVGKITSDYKFDKSLDWVFQHYREIEWINTEVPRSAFQNDLLYSFGAAMTICGIERNDAENRVKKLIATDFQKMSKENEDVANNNDDELLQDYETLLLDDIYNYIERKFKGHGMERLVEGILNAQGYKTWRTEGGPDGGMDILAAPDQLGFGSPRICVQVKSQDTPLDRPTLDQLRGGMNRSKATHGLLVCWGGFKSSVTRDIPQQFFEVRLWDKQELVKQLLQSYQNLDEDLRAEIPLKQVWMLAVPRDE
ncbi:MAG: restriction endonuclease [Desulfovibrio sp.]|nr:restriction endonuclease [Desulfovibrio sp.]